MKLQVKIAKCWDETSDIKCFELVPCEAADLASAEPGAHIDVHVGENLVRQYSLFNGPKDAGRYYIGVKKEISSRGGSIGMHRLAAGRTLKISTPKNNFPLSDAEGKSILMAGGIGITPLLSMARHLAASNRPFELHLFSRSEQDTPFKSVLAELGESASTHPGLEQPERDALVTELLHGRSADMHVYTCGPKPFMHLVLSTAEREGWKPDNIHLEYFSAVVPAAAADDAAFEVVLARTGRSVVVAPDQTIVEAILAEGLDVITSCEQGVCGTCLTTVLEGEPDHRDIYLSPAERLTGKLMMPCVSRCKGSRLVLDL